MVGKRYALWFLWSANLAVIIGVWSVSNGDQLFSGAVPPLIVLARLFGLLAAYSALVQLVCMARARWIEGVFGLDRITRFHRLNGFAVVSFLVLHAGSMILGHSTLQVSSVISVITSFASQPVLLMAQLAFVLFFIIVGVSLYIVRRHLKFETWYFVHLLAYGAVALAAFHQFVIGSTLQSFPIFRWYWIALYVCTGVLVLWRFMRPVYYMFRYDFRVERVVPEAERAASVYISGKNLHTFRAKAGQFIMVRFLAPGLWWQEHPFSLSKLPDEKQVRITVRQLGDFTSHIPRLRSGTPVMISGPHGAYTHERTTQQKILYIAGGIGITPIRSLIEAQKTHESVKHAVLLYANRSKKDAAFHDELRQFERELPLAVHFVYDNEPGYDGEIGYIDAEKIARLVPDVRERDVFLCGPPQMMQGVMKSLHGLGVPKRHIHTESFSLHVK